MLVKLITSSKDKKNHIVISINGIGEQGEVLIDLGVEVYDLRVSNYLLFPFKFIKLRNLVNI